MRDVLIAAIAALAPTIASIAALLKVTRVSRTTDAINTAVNHQPKDAPTLINRVIELNETIGKLDRKTDGIAKKMSTLEAAQKRHMAWHQEQAESA